MGKSHRCFYTFNSQKQKTQVTPYKPVEKEGIKKHKIDNKKTTFADLKYRYEHGPI